MLKTLLGMNKTEDEVEFSKRTGPQSRLPVGVKPGFNAIHIPNNTSEVGPLGIPDNTPRDGGISSSSGFALNPELLMARRVVEEIEKAEENSAGEPVAPNEETLTGAKHGGGVKQEASEDTEDKLVDAVSKEKPEPSSEDEDSEDEEEDDEVKDTIIGQENWDFWKPRMKAMLKILKQKKIRSIIGSVFRVISAEGMIKMIEEFMQDPMMFDLDTMKIVSMKPMQKNCIPAHVFAIECLLLGDVPSAKVLNEMVTIWKDIKTTAKNGIEQIEMVEKIMLPALIDHCRAASTRYLTMLVINDDIGMDTARAMHLRVWIKELKALVEEQKEKAVASIKQKMYEKALENSYNRTTRATAAAQIRDKYV